MVYILLLLITFVYIFFMTPNVSTGDGGDFVTTAYTLGISHPSGYPLYLEILKLFSYLPVGNIAERMAIATVFFSVVSLYLLFQIVKQISYDHRAGWFSVVYLALVYSYLGQSVIIKFYTLNLFIIGLLILTGIYVIRNGYSSKAVFLSSFLLGLSTGNHHTALFMVIPLFSIGILYGRKFFFDLGKSIPLFLAGFMVNLHMIIRSFDSKAFMFMPANSWSLFWDVFFRKVYGKSSSFDTFFSFSSQVEGYLYTMKNVFFLIEKNFTIAGLFLFIIGLSVLFFRNRKLFTFLFLTFFVYSVFFGKMTFSQKQLDLETLYVVGHQYFLPMFFLFVIFVSVGMDFIYSLLKKKNFVFLHKTVPYIAVLFPMMFIFDRLLDQNFGNNFVPYSYNKTVLASLPVSSFYVSVGDNKIFPSWYLKDVLGFRRDVCNISNVMVEKNQFILWGCKPTANYDFFYRRLFNQNLVKVAKFSRLYSSIHVYNMKSFTKFLDSKYYIFEYQWLNREDEKKLIAERDKRFIENQRLVRTATQDCLHHRTDDFYTLNLCRFVSYNYAVLNKILQENPVYSVFFDTEISKEYIEDIFFKLSIYNRNDRSFYYVK